MTTRFRVALSLAWMILVSLSRPVFAQTPTVPVAQVGPCQITTNEPAQQLTTAYYSAKWEGFQEVARGLLSQLRASSCPKTVDGIESMPREVDYTVIIWRGKPPVGDVTLLTAVVAPQGQFPFAPYSLKLPGLSSDSSVRLHQVFVSDRERDSVAAVYVSTRQQNPLLDQIPAVVTAIVDPLLALSASTQGRLLASRTATDRTGGWLTSSRVVLPFDRAGVELHLRGLQAPTAEQLIKDLGELKERLSLVEARYASCAVEFAGELVTLIDGEKTTCATAASGAACLKSLNEDIMTRYKTQLARCKGDEAAIKSLQLVDTRFRTFLVEMTDKPITGKSDLKNVPLERYSFGLVSGVMFGNRSTAKRVKVDDGNVVEDPLSRQINMVVVNRSFRSFDPTAVTTGDAERNRWFIGAVVSPSFGVTTGYSRLIVKGLAANVGVAVIGVNGPQEGQMLNAPPVDDNDPFRLQATFGWFLGASYNFK